MQICCTSSSLSCPLSLPYLFTQLHLYLYFFFFLLLCQLSLVRSSVGSRWIGRSRAASMSSTASCSTSTASLMWSSWWATPTCTATCCPSTTMTTTIKPSPPPALYSGCSCRGKVSAAQLLEVLNHLLVQSSVYISLQRPSVSFGQLCREVWARLLSCKVCYSALSVFCLDNLKDEIVKNKTKRSIAFLLFGFKLPICGVCRPHGAAISNQTRLSSSSVLLSSAQTHRDQQS